MNRLLEGIADFCGSHLLDEKVLLAPSLSTGRQIAEALARNGHPWVNLRVETIRTLAMSAIGPELAGTGKKLLSRAQSLAMVEQACASALDEKSYFGRLRDRAGLHRAMQQTLGDLRASGISPGIVSTGALESEKKGMEIRAVLEAYEKSLQQDGYVDDSDVLRLALEKLKNGQMQAEPAPWFLVPEGLDASAAEKDFLRATAGSRLQVVPVDDPARWGMQSLDIRRALGEENEVREVFRTVLRENLPFDDVEIIYTDSATYVPLIYEMSSQYGVPCTFAQGIPVTFSRPGQAALGFLEWLVSGYDTNVLRKTIAEGCVSFQQVTPEGDPPGGLAVARTIREARIGWGRERYISCLDSLQRDHLRRLERAGEESDGDETQLSKAGLEERLRVCAVTRSFIEKLLEVSAAAESDKIDYSSLACGLLEFLKEFANVTSEIDGLALSTLSTVIGELAQLPSVRTTLPQAVERLREAVTQTCVNASTSHPGHLHISEYWLGGYSGRGHTFVIGLDESRFPGKSRQDPVLLDIERAAINESVAPRQLPLLGEKPVENSAALNACLARLRGSVYLSFSCRDLVDDRDQFPAAVVLDAYRRKTNDASADYSHLLEALPSPAGFIAEDGVFLDESEWWLGRLKSVGAAANGAQAGAHAVYPWLNRGERAEMARDGAMFTAFDGLIANSHDLSPCSNGAVMSPSMLEALGRCPFGYFLRYVLRISPLEDRTLDPTKWLDSLEYGSLMHGIFYRFMERITRRGEKPSVKLHKDEIRDIANGMIAEQVKLIPPPNTPAFEAQREDILRTCGIFLALEEEHCRDVTPRFFEVPFGSPGWRSSAAISSEVPVNIELGNGSRIRLAGRIDRVDESSDQTFQIWDYKTGSARRIREESLFDCGRQLQHALYAAAVEELLRRAGIIGEVVTSGYFFPALRGEGQRIAKRKDLEKMRMVLLDLVELLHSGVFPATIDDGDCRYCNFSSICAGAPGRSKIKLEDSSNVLLEPIRRLRANGD